MKRWLHVAAVALLAAGLAFGCKGETTYKDSPDTIARLDTCQKERQKKDDYIKNLEGQVADLKANATAGELLVTMEGTIEVVGKTGGGGKLPAAAPTPEQYNGFRKAAHDAQGAMRRCYQTALKKDSSLQASPIEVDVRVTYNTDGSVKRVGLNKKVSPNFAACVSAVAKGWKIPAGKASMTFSQTFELMPK